MKIRINSDDDMSLENILNIQTGMVFIGLMFNNNYNLYHNDVRLVNFILFHVYYLIRIKISSI